MATVLITGGTGLIGRALTKRLTEKGYEVIVLTRQLKITGQKKANLMHAYWDIQHQQIERTAIEKADYIIHLAGANVAEGRWTQKRKKEIAESRTKSASLLVKALKEIPNQVKAVISASAIGWYGPDPQIPNPNPFVENDPAHDSFLGNTCKLWEESMDPVSTLGIRLVKLRTGIVLSNKGGAFAEFKKPMKFGAATIMGNGRQVVSWIHIADIVDMYVYALENENLSGVFNAVAPYPVSNKELILTMAKEKKGIAVPVSVPKFVLKTMLGEMSIEVLKSATVSSKKIENAGYQFLFPTIEGAVKNLMNV